MHYYRHRKGADMDAPKRHRSVTGRCEHPGCERAHLAKGYCVMHYHRMGNGRDMDLPVRASPRYGGRTCRIRDCTRKAVGKGLCKLHYMRKRSGTGEPRKYAEVGDTQVYDHGYITERTANGWKMQHRLVMERHLGRPLNRDEKVHHVNGDRQDNRIENLEIWSRSHPPGQRLVDKIKWAKEFLIRYGETLD